MGNKERARLRRTPDPHANLFPPARTYLLFVGHKPVALDSLVRADGNIRHTSYKLFASNPPRVRSQIVQLIEKNPPITGQERALPTRPPILNPASKETMTPTQSMMIVLVLACRVAAQDVAVANVAAPNPAVPGLAPNETMPPDMLPRSATPHHSALSATSAGETSSQEGSR